MLLVRSLNSATLPRRFIFSFSAASLLLLTASSSRRSITFSLLLLLILTASSFPTSSTYLTSMALLPSSSLPAPHSFFDVFSLLFPLLLSFLSTATTASTCYKIIYKFRVRIALEKIFYTQF